MVGTFISYTFKSITRFRLFGSNVKQVLNVSQVFAAKMIEAGIKGAIVNMSSQVSQ